MALTVVNVAFPLAVVGPDAVGGAEQVVAQLDAALTAAGHRSIVIAPEDSRVRGVLVPIRAPPPVLDGAAWERAHEQQRAALAYALRRWPVDVVHLHGVDFDRYLPPPGPPVLVTLHLPAEAYRPQALRPVRPRTFLHCVSRSQRARFPRELPFLPEIENGVDLDRFRPAGRAWPYALSLGRVCEAKGTDLALEAAARAGRSLVIAGMVHPFPEHLRYYEERVRPRLGARARHVGPVSGARTRRLLAGAACLVVASRAAETCSLAALEALASGTPVVAFRRGALPDLLEHGRTGFLATSLEELARGIAAAPGLDRAACRRTAEARFRVEATVRRYLERYRILALGAIAPAVP